jgi:hypothetical protein
VRTSFMKQPLLQSWMHARSRMDKSRIVIFFRMNCLRQEGARGVGRKVEAVE